MQIYFANIAGKPVKMLFNSNQQQLSPQQPQSPQHPQQHPQQQQPPPQIALPKKSMIHHDRELTLRDSIKIEVVGVFPSKLKINPDIYAFNIPSILANRGREKIDFLDELETKNKERLRQYRELKTFSQEVFNIKETNTNPGEMNDPVAEVVNLLGCDHQKASIYLKRYGSVEKVFLGYQEEQSNVEQFKKKYSLKEEEARFYLEWGGHDINQAITLMNNSQ